MDEPKIGISMVGETNKLLADVLGALNPSELKELTIDRDLEDSEGLAGEPITIGAVIAGGTVVISAVLRLLERHLEHNQQRAMAKLVAENFDRDPKLVAELAMLAKKYADVSIKYGVAKEAWQPQTKTPETKK
jgi:hypothetical protein